MSGITQTDVLIKEAIELGLADLRQNTWLISHALGDFAENKYLSQKYGQKHINSCVEWFLNNQVDIYLRPRNDRDRMPCVAIVPGNGPEKDEMKHMADSSTETIVLMPQQINKPIPYIMKPFTPNGYEIGSGLIELDTNLKGFDNVSVGMIVVNPENGNGYVITDVTSEGIWIEAGTDLEASQLAVVPKNQFYTARIEHTFFQETFNVVCYAHGDPQAASWLHSLVLYSILRYRESLLEAQGFMQSSVSNSPLEIDPYYGQSEEYAYMRSITLTGMTEYSWIKTPRRTIETVALREKTNEGYIGGIKILSNLDSPDDIDKSEEIWYTVEDNE